MRKRKEKKNKIIKICFAASSGGHLHELLMLRPLMEKYDSFLVTEKTAYPPPVGELNCHYLLQVNRRERWWPFLLAGNGLYSLIIMLTEKPDVVICTGVLATIPLCLLCKLMGKKLVFIESFANVKTPSLTGRFLYRFSDQFYIQWPKLKKYYPEAVYQGGVY